MVTTHKYSRKKKNDINIQFSKVIHIRLGYIVLVEKSNVFSSEGIPMLPHGEGTEYNGTNNLIFMGKFLHGKQIMPNSLGSKVIDLCLKWHTEDKISDFPPKHKIIL